MTVTVYPEAPAERDRFVLTRRSARPFHDPWRHQGLVLEDERGDDGRVGRTATVFLTGRECPWRCVMCDLWMYTTTDDTPKGALVQQVRAAIDELAGAGPLPPTLKLYNAGSFFDPRAVPEADYDALAAALQPFRRVVVESHPSLVGPRFVRFVEACRRAAGNRPGPRLEVAMGLETVHPAALAALHKRFTLEQFASAAAALSRAGADLRVFLLVGVPFIGPDEQVAWVRRSVSCAFDMGATAVSLIPTRPGNGTLETLAASGEFVPPLLDDLEAAFDAAMPIGRERMVHRLCDTRVFADLWNVDRLATCPSCRDARRHRLAVMNLEQRALPPVHCTSCQPAGVAS